MCEGMNINFKLTNAESLLSNRRIESHNLVLADIFLLTRQTTGFRHIKYQCAYTDESPASTNLSSNNIIKENLSFIHKASEAFIRSENFEGVWRALDHNVWA